MNFEFLNDSVSNFDSFKMHFSREKKTLKLTNFGKIQNIPTVLETYRSHFFGSNNLVNQSDLTGEFGVK